MNKREMLRSLIKATQVGLEYCSPLKEVRIVFITKTLITIKELGVLKL